MTMPYEFPAEMPGELRADLEASNVLEHVRQFVEWTEPKGHLPEPEAPAIAFLVCHDGRIAVTTLYQAMALAHEHVMYELQLRCEEFGARALVAVIWSETHDGFVIPALLITGSRSYEQAVVTYEYSNGELFTETPHFFARQRRRVATYPSARLVRRLFANEVDLEGDLLIRPDNERLCAIAHAYWAHAEEFLAPHVSCMFPRLQYVAGTPTDIDEYWQKVLNAQLT